MKALGLGACLADDMGLGKTIQIIALLNYIRTRKHEKTLLIVPASLISNWMSEIDKFAPSLKYYVIHPSENKALEKDDSSCVKENELFITTYGMLLKYDWLKNITWDSLILDEAQAIKNPGTKQTKTVKQLKASYKVALTGTPIENRLSDLWSLFDFLNKGLLGSAKEFTDFTKSLKESQDGYSRLKQVVGPFILRRLKTDKTVISDLPEKIEMKTYSTLSKKQVVLYNKLVNDIKDKLESSGEGIERKGLVLSSLMKFQINILAKIIILKTRVENLQGFKKFVKPFMRNVNEFLYLPSLKRLLSHLRIFLKPCFIIKVLYCMGGHQ